MAIFRYGCHPWILVPTWCPPCIFTNFSWAKSHNFFIKQKSKFTEIFNICWKHVPFILCRSSQFDQMFYISVNFDFCIMKKLWDLAHEKLVNIQGGHHVGTNIHGWQPHLKIAIYVLKSAIGGLLSRDWLNHHLMADNICFKKQTWTNHSSIQYYDSSKLFFLKQTLFEKKPNNFGGKLEFRS